MLDLVACPDGAAADFLDVFKVKQERRGFAADAVVDTSHACLPVNGGTRHEANLVSRCRRSVFALKSATM